ncbi:hypothetical protein BJV82DRAFT_245843 [Fennellomyces sp. T-0311]|nr:hypothetical protein BJV82DRAFT_245843 [Fennellomyces sp. T-0311]
MTNSSTRELILYLEPMHGSPFRIHVDNFIENSRMRFHFTTACKYDCHSSMTGFFSVQQNDLQQIIDTLNTIIHSKSTLLGRDTPKVKTTPLLVRKATAIIDQGTQQPRVINEFPVHLLLPLAAPEPYHKVVSEFAEKYPAIRPKAINHISLGYWDEPHATPEQNAKWNRLVLEDRLMERMYEAARETFRNDISPNEWDIVLYERTLKGVNVGNRHEFMERGRWPATRQ